MQAFCRKCNVPRPHRSLTLARLEVNKYGEPTRTIEIECKDCGAKRLHELGPFYEEPKL